MAGSKNNTHYSAGYNLYPVTAPDIVTLQLKTDATQIINVSGSPENNEAANVGSIALDRTNGDAYLKVTGTGNTGWQQIATGTDVPETFVGDTGSATPAAGILNVLGAGSLTTVASGNTVETQLTGTTNHSLLVATGTSTLTNLGVATNGQLPIGSTGADPVLATITAGTGVTITNGAGSITIDAEGGGLTWSEETSTPLSGAVGHGYIVNNVGLFTIDLPGTFAVGDVIAIVGKGAGLWVIDAPAGDTVNFGNQSTSAGGTVTATHRYDCLEIIGTIANDTWTVRSSIGNFTIA